MRIYTRPNLVLKDSEGNIVGSYEFEYQAIKAAKLQFAGTYTLERPTGSYQGGSGETVVAPIAPAAPSTLVATAFSSTVITLAWADNSDNETGFVIERSLDGVTGWSVIHTTAPLIIAYVDANLTPETEYFYRVKATNTGVDSTYTLTDSTTTLAVVTETPPSTDIPALKRTEIEDSFSLLPQDANGWTIFEPTANTMVYYIDYVNGDDDTATPYASTAFADMKNPTMAGLVTYKTLSAAWNGVSGDVWFLLRGGTDHNFGSTGTRSVVAGTSHTVRAVVAGYDTTANGMPRMTYQDAVYGCMRYWKGSSYNSLIGIDFTQRPRDPEHAEFVGWGLTGQEGLGVQGGFTSYGKPAEQNIDCLIEGCKFHFAICTLHNHRETVVRRNTFTNNYSEFTHAQGVYATVSSVLLEENVFDHTGWWNKGEIGGAEATIFNHNTYFSDSDHCIFRGNIFSRPSSIGNKWTSNPDAATPSSASVNSIFSSNILLEDNLYIDCEMAMSIGGNDDYDDGPRFQDMYVLNNFVVDCGLTQQTNRTLAWGIEANDWITGVISGNVVQGADSDVLTNSFGIHVRGHTSDVSVNDNVIYNTGPQNVEGSSYSLKVRQAEIDATYTNSNSNPMFNVSFASNYIQNPNSLNRQLWSTCESGVAFTANTFYSAANDPEVAFSVLDVDMDAATWNASVGGTNIFAQTTFVDATRTTGTYMGSIGNTATKAAFLTSIRAQTYDNWNPLLMGKPVVDYLRAGFVPV